MPRASIPVTITLTPYITALREVKIGYKKPEIIKAGSPEKTNNSNLSIMPGMQQAVFMDGSAGVNGTIQTVGFFICDGGRLLQKASGDFTAPFRIRVYEVAEDGGPGKELTNDMIIIAAKKNKAWFDIDISRYGIVNPAKGFFVTFALLSADYYGVNSKSSRPRWALGSSIDTQTPHLGLRKGGKVSQSYVKTTRDGMGSWHKQSNNLSCLVRATITVDTRP